MEFDPEIYNSATDIFVFRFRDGAGYKKFAEYAHEREAHIFVCDNRNFTVTTDAFTKEEVLRIAKVSAGLSTISIVSLKGVDFVSEGQLIWTDSGGLFTD